MNCEALKSEHSGPFLLWPPPVELSNRQHALRGLLLFLRARRDIPPGIWLMVEMVKLSLALLPPPPSAFPSQFSSVRQGILWLLLSLLNHGGEN